MGDAIPGADERNPLLAHAIFLLGPAAFLLPFLFIDWLFFNGPRWLALFFLMPWIAQVATYFWASLFRLLLIPAWRRPWATFVVGASLATWSAYIAWREDLWTMSLRTFIFCLWQLSSFGLASLYVAEFFEQRRAVRATPDRF